MLWIKNNVRLLTGICLSLALGLGAGYGLRGIVEQPQEQPQVTPSIVAEPVGQIGKPSILPTTEVTMRYKFLLCGHEIDQMEYDGPLTGFTLEDVTSHVEGARVMELNAQRALVVQELESYCPAHYVLFLNGGDKLCISHTDSTDLEMENIQILSYDISVLPADALLMLEEGLVFDGLEEINAFLEDVES